VTTVYVRELHTEISESSVPAPPVQADARDPKAVAEAAAIRAERARWLVSRVASEGFDD
jgi:hypothetical protein